MICITCIVCINLICNGYIEVELTDPYNCMVLQVHSSMYNQNLFPARTKTDTTAQLEKRFLQPTRSVGRFLQPARSECIVPPSVSLSVCKG